MRLETSMYCDFIDGECFHWGMCDNCAEKINAAAYDMLDDYHYSSEEFRKSSGWIFTPEEFQKVYDRMVEIEDERALLLLLINGGQRSEAQR